ncbi:hypothetical protein SCLCIDRAFT_1208227 [Scleroderma citrinum Foug A]|uniref:Uncharacterized protein n=1 Tax=Scleroderma citrinum Foug A TaxID=1036808 RepID=A0A0C3AXL3_9AGAM|nr:hypothetical protein SCLCIDRAFT_1208227 [Scleroderma citrinum Foug A]
MSPKSGAESSRLKTMTLFCKESFLQYGRHKVRCDVTFPMSMSTCKWRGHYIVKRDE